MHPITRRQRWRYWFDNLMAKGPLALIALVVIASLLFVVVMAVVLALTGISPAGEPPLSFVDAAWSSLMRAIDPGAMGGDEGWSFRWTSLLLTITGIFLLSTLIGVITSGIESRLSELRKGRSFVVERDHTLILGWSSQVFSIIEELVVANANQPRRAIVVLADEDKVAMEDAIRARVPRPGRTRVVCRTGSPIDPVDLERANPNAARAIVVVSPEVDDPDAHVIKTLLALTNAPSRRPDPFHIVASIRDEKNLAIARMVGKDEAHVILAGDLIARIAVQTCLQSGLSAVYTELLDFDDNEFYFVPSEPLVGLTFGEALLRFDDAALVGMALADGEVRVLPPMDTRIAASDRAIVIALDDDTARIVDARPDLIKEDAMQTAAGRPRSPERTLILGWNQRAPLIIAHLDAYVAPGSEVRLVAEASTAADAIRRRCPSLHNVTVRTEIGDTTDRATIETVATAECDHVIVLGDTDTLRPQEADARTLVTLLHLRDLAERSHLSFSIVGEMLDPRNRELAEATRADDFIVSDRLVSLILSQVSENRALASVFDVLFDPRGAELYLKPATDYVAAGRPVPFLTVVEAARRRGEAAVGYRLRGEATQAGKWHGVHLNPAKAEVVTFAEADRIIVLAED